MNKTRKKTRKRTKKPSKKPTKKPNDTTACLQYTGVTSFRNYSFLRPTWIPYNQQSEFTIKKSKLKDAGQGVFTTKSYQQNQFLMYIEGEPLEPWYYHAIDTDYITGIQLHAPRLGKMIWKCVVNTVGCKINCSQYEATSNVEFVVSHNALDHHSRSIHGDQFMLLLAKKPIKKGEELLVYYGASFWQQKNKLFEVCAICLQEDTSSKNPMYLCDGTCGYGYHLQCLKKLQKPIPRSQKKWFCFNCS